MYIGVLIYFCCMYVYIGEVLYCPYYKRPALRHYQRRFYSLPFVRHKDTYSVLLTHDNLCKPTQVKQVVVAAIVILTTMWCGWTMNLYIDSVKFLLEAPGASILWRRFYLVTASTPIGGRFY